MAKLIDKQINVTHDNKSIPLTFRWKGKYLPVGKVLEVWKDIGTWWDGESEKTFYRLETPEGNLYELYRDNINKTWFLYRIYD